MGAALRVMVVGCGAAAERLHGGSLRDGEQRGLVQVVALVDPSPERLAHIGRSFPKARRHADLTAGLAEPSDLAIIASPHRFHAEQALACFDAGLHVLVEKPMALTEADATSMLRAAKAANRVLAVAQARRFYPSVQAIGSLIESEVLGRPLTFNVQEGRNFDWPISWSGFYEPEQAGGGVLADLGPHAFGLLSSWLGDLTVDAYTDDAADGIEVNCSVGLNAASGATGKVIMSRDVMMTNRYVINCERGWVAFDMSVADRFDWGWSVAPYEFTSTISTRKAQGPMWSGGDKDNAATDLRAYRMAQLENVIAAIRGEAPLLASAEDAARCIALIEQCYRLRESARLFAARQTGNGA